MKICIYTDPHWCTYSSIFKQRGKTYSKRLENLIASINRVQDFAKHYECDRVLCLGDFHDKNTWSAEELTALTEINWLNVKQQFLVGNHELVEDDTDKPNSATIFTNMGFEVIDKVRVEHLDNVELVYLPYMKEENRLALKDIDVDKTKKCVVFSHNDIKMRYGFYECTTGYDKSDIENFCDLFINGHIHNCGFVNEKETILNLGNLTGLNFSEDGFKYKHYFIILDTDTLEIQYFINDDAVYFYNIVVNNENDLAQFEKLENNSIVSIKVKESLWEKTKQKLLEHTNIITYRKNFLPDLVAEEKENVAILEKENHLDKLREFVIDKLGNTNIVKTELEEICK